MHLQQNGKQKKNNIYSIHIVSIKDVTSQSRIY